MANVSEEQIQAEMNEAAELEALFRDCIPEETNPYALLLAATALLANVAARLPHVPDEVMVSGLIGFRRLCEDRAKATAPKADADV